MKYFVNLEELDISENPININDLRFLPVLRSLKLRSSMLEQIPIDPNPDIFANLQILDLGFNKLPSMEIKNIFNIPTLRSFSL